MSLFPGFGARRFDVGDVTINGVVGGAGPPLLLLHGYPQTHAMWHRVAPRLATRFTLVATDLRGYGMSGKPATTADHGPYSKRAMAADQVAVMASLGFDRFGLVGHDRGGRVAHRLLLDHPGRVDRWAVLDIVPTRTMYERTSRAFAEAYYHWFFLIRPAPFPERLIGADPDVLWGRHGVVERCFSPLADWRAQVDTVTGRALDCGHYLAEERPDETAAALLDFFA